MNDINDTVTELNENHDYDSEDIKMDELLDDLDDMVAEAYLAQLNS